MGRCCILIPEPAAVRSWHRWRWSRRARPMAGRPSRGSTTPLIAVGLKGLSGLVVRRQCAFTLGDAPRAQLAWGELVSGNYFEVLGVKPSLGRVFTREEAGDSLGAYPVAVISTRLWRSYFHFDAAIVGKTMRVNRHWLTIVGVVPGEFRGTGPVMQYDFWVPVTMAAVLGELPDSTFRERGERGMLDAMCRLRAGV